MKKAKLLWIFLLTAMFLVSCGKSPQEKIVGEWMNNEKQFGFSINPDGIIKKIERGQIQTIARWELSDEDSLILKILENGSLAAEFAVTFITDDEIKLEIQGDKITLKRKK